MPATTAPVSIQLSSRIFTVATTATLQTNNDAQTVRVPPKRACAPTYRRFRQEAMGATFVWPAFLWVLLSIPLLAVLYARVLKRTSRHAVILSTTATLIAAKGGGKMRHLPPALLALSLIVLIVATARPVLPLPVPADRSAIMLAMDVSGSMRSTDIAPSRLEAAKSSAKAFLRSLPTSVRVGFVAFAGYAGLLAPPGTDHARIEALIDGVSTARRTAIGDGLLEAVAALPGRVRPDPNGTLPAAPALPLPPGMIVLLSDGRSNAGMDPLKAAAIAAQQQVTVYTVGVGQRVTPDNTWTIGGTLDEETLQTIASLTGGTYYHASSAQGLRDVYRKLARSLGWERRPTDVSAAFAGITALLLTAALAASWLRVHPLGSWEGAAGPNHVPLPVEGEG